MLKFASFEVTSAVLVPKNAGPARLARIRRQAHRHHFDYEPRPGYLYVRCRAISSRTNDNYDEFPAEEIKKGYQTFIGKPVFVNHVNDNHRLARGVILDAALHEDTLSDGEPDTWVELLQEIDAIKFPKLTKAILSKRIDRTSMGCDVDKSVCSMCGNEATTPAEYCNHIPRLKGKKVLRRNAATGQQEEHLIRETCYGLRFFENSLLVEPPADPTAHFLGVDDHSGMQVAASKTASLQVEASNTEPIDLLLQHWDDGAKKIVGHSEADRAAAHSELQALREQGHTHVQTRETHWDGKGRFQPVHPSTGVQPIEKAIGDYAARAAEGNGDTDPKSIYSPNGMAQVYAPRVQALIDLQNQGFTHARWGRDYDGDEVNKWHGAFPSDQPSRYSSLNDTDPLNTSQCVSRKDNPTYCLWHKSEHLEPNGEPRGDIDGHGNPVEFKEPPRCDLCNGFHDSLRHYDAETQNDSREDESALDGLWDDSRDGPIHPGDKHFGSLIQRFAMTDDEAWEQDKQQPCHLCGSDNPNRHEQAHTLGEHFDLNEGKGLDAWGQPIRQPYDGHGAFNCNNYECAEHPKEMYEQGPGAVSMPGWMQHDLSPDRDVAREVGKAFYDQGLTDDGRYLLDQQHEGPSKYSSLTQRFASMYPQNHTHLGDEPYCAECGEHRAYHPHLHGGQWAKCDSCGRDMSHHLHDAGRYEHLQEQRHKDPLAPTTTTHLFEDHGTDYPLRDQATCPHDGSWNLHGQCKQCGWSAATEDDEECDHPYCQENGFPEGWHTKGEHMDPPHLDPGHPDYQHAQRTIEDALGDHPLAFLLDQNHRDDGTNGPSKYSSLVSMFAAADDTSATSLTGRFASGFGRDEADQWAKCDQGHTHWGAAGAAGLLIRHTDDRGTHRYLLQHRAPWVDDGDTWGIPAGALHYDEHPKAGAVREAMEEMGNLPHDMQHLHTHTDDHGGWAFHTVMMQSPSRWGSSGGEDASHEVGEGGTQWFTSKEMEGLPLHSGFKKTWDSTLKDQMEPQRKQASADDDGPHILGPTHLPGSDDVIKTDKICEECGKPANHIHISPEAQAEMRAAAEAGQMHAEMADAAQKRVVDLNDPVDLRAHMMTAHGYDDSDFWRTSHDEDHPALDPHGFDDEDRPLRAHEVRRLHDWEHGHGIENDHPDYDGGMPGTFMGDSHFHTASRKASLESDLYPDAYEDDNGIQHDVCAHCFKPVRSTSDHAVPWVHKDSHNSKCDVGSPADAVMLQGVETNEAEPLSAYGGRKTAGEVHDLAEERAKRTCPDCEGAGTDYDGYYGCDGCGGDGTMKAYLQRQSVRKKATWIGDHLDEPSLFWRAPKTKQWEVHIHNHTPDRELREGYGAKPSQQVTLYHADQMSPPHPANPGGRPRGGWDYERNSNTGEMRYVPNAWGAIASGIPAHVQAQVDKAQAAVDEHAANHADLYGQMAEQQDIRDDLRRVPSDMAAEEKGQRMMRHLLRSANESVCPACDGEPLKNIHCTMCDGKGYIRHEASVKTAMGPARCLVCGEGIKATPTAEIPFGARKGQPYPNEGWSHHDGMLRDHPAIPHDDRTADQQRTQDRAAMDQARMQVREHMNQMFERMSREGTVEEPEDERRPQNARDSSEYTQFGPSSFTSDGGDSGGVSGGSSSTASLRKQADEDTCPWCHGDGLPTGRDLYLCQDCKQPFTLAQNRAMASRRTAAKLPGGFLEEESDPQDYWAKPTGKAPYDPTKAHYGLEERQEGHGPWNVVRHPETRAYHLIDNQGRSVHAYGPSSGLSSYELHDHDAERRAYDGAVTANQDHGHIPKWHINGEEQEETGIPRWGGNGQRLPGAERARRKGEPVEDAFGIDAQHIQFHFPAPDIEHTTEDPKVADYKKRAAENPAPKVYPAKSVMTSSSREHGTTYKTVQHGEPDYDDKGAFHSPSPDDEWHGPYRVIQHPETGKFHVADNQNRVTGYGGRGGVDEQHHAEYLRDYADGRQASKERARGLAESLWGGAMDILDPGGTDESRRAESNQRNMSKLMDRYEGGDHHPLHPGKFGYDEDDDDNGQPYYEVTDPGGSGWKARDYGGTRVRIHHAATGDQEHDSYSSDDRSDEKPEGFGHDELHQTLRNFVHGDPSESPENRYAPAPDYAEAEPKIKRWQQRNGYHG